MIDRTNKNLAAFCLSVVGAPYWFGCFGQKGSESLYKSKKAQYPQYYQFDKSTYKDDYGTRVTDCAGLLKWFLWSDNMTNKAPTYKSSEDYGANGFYLKATEKGKIGTIPTDKVGLMVFKGTDVNKTHIGIVVDNNGTVVEAKGHNYGTVKSNISEWKYWGRCHLIFYSNTVTVEVPKKGYTGTFPTLPSRGYFQRGDTGTNVMRLQQFLKWYDCTLLPKYGVDGDIGSETIFAVKVFQQREGLTVDGLFGKKSLAKAKEIKK